jgi:dihydroorotase
MIMPLREFDKMESSKNSKWPKALWEALLDGRIDVVATDHAPHTLEEKKQPYLKAPSEVR